MLGARPKRDKGIRYRWRAVCVAVAFALSACSLDGAETARIAQEAADTSSAAVERGEYLFNAANCAGCHTDAKHGGPRLAGGRGIETPFGTYYTRNITPDREHGIGAWTDAQFIRALRDGISPSGAHYFAAFPFTSFTLMSDHDLLDIKAYLAVQAPSAQADRPQDAPFPFDVRASMVLWRLLYFRPGPFVPDPSRSAAWNRGAYLVTAVAHCGECHTPRNWLGAVNPDQRFAGALLYGPARIRAPNITPDVKNGIGSWSVEDIAFLLKSGFKQDGDTVNSTMGEVVEGTAKLTDSDRLAIAAYLKSLPPLPGNGP
jgi:mono/diheme cytochrome c family protein